MEIKEFIKLEDEIKQILIDDPRTRNDDMYLYFVYCCKKINDKNFWLRMEDVFEDKEKRDSIGIRSFTSVIRVRRKIQAQCKELASERVKKARAKKKEEFKEYARL